MEFHVASSKIHLLTALEFSGSRVAPYITARSQITTHNSGASLYGCGDSGSRVCRFEPNTSVGSMLDLSSLVVTGTEQNLDATSPNQLPLTIVALSLSGLLASARVTIGGVEVSSCNYIAWTEHLLGIMQKDSERRRDYAEGFGLAAQRPMQITGITRASPSQAVAPGTSFDGLEPSGSSIWNLFVQFRFAWAERLC